MKEARTGKPAKSHELKAKSRWILGVKSWKLKAKKSGHIKKLKAKSFIVKSRKGSFIIQLSSSACGEISDFFHSLYYYSKSIPVWGKLNITIVIIYQNACGKILLIKEVEKKKKKRSLRKMLKTRVALDWILYFMMLFLKPSSLLLTTFL